MTYYSLLEDSIHLAVDTGTDDIIITNPGRFGPESFRPGRFGLGRFGLNLDVGRFGLFWWVVSALSRFGQFSLCGIIFQQITKVLNIN